MDLAVHPRRHQQARPRERPPPGRPLPPLPRPVPHRSADLLGHARQRQVSLARQHRARPPHRPRQRPRRRQPLHLHLRLCRPLLSGARPALDRSQRRAPSRRLRRHRLDQGRASPPPIPPPSTPSGSSPTSPSPSPPTARSTRPPPSSRPSPAGRPSRSPAPPSCRTSPTPSSSIPTARPTRSRPQPSASGRPQLRQRHRRPNFDPLQQRTYNIQHRTIYHRKLMTTSTTAPRTLFEKVWQSHLVAEPAGEPALLYIDLQLVHEVTSPQAFDGLRLANRKVRRPGPHRRHCGPQRSHHLHRRPSQHRRPDLPRARLKPSAATAPSSASSSSTCNLPRRASSTSSAPSLASPSPA